MKTLLEWVKDEECEALSEMAKAAEDANKEAVRLSVKLREVDDQLSAASVSRPRDTAAAAARYLGEPVPPGKIEKRPAEPVDVDELRDALMGLKNRIQDAERDSAHEQGRFKKELVDVLRERAANRVAAEIAEKAEELRELFVVLYTAEMLKPESTDRRGLVNEAFWQSLFVPGTDSKALPELRGASHRSARGHVLFNGEDVAAAASSALAALVSAVTEKVGSWPLMRTR